MAHDFEVMRICVLAYLKDARSASRKMDAAEDQVRAVESRLNAMGVNYDKPGGSSGYLRNDAIPDGVAELEDARSRLADVIAQVHAEFIEASMICSENEQRMVVWRHYVDGLTWSYIARDVCMSERNAQRLANDGIREIYYAMPEQWRRWPIPNAM